MNASCRDRFGLAALLLMGALAPAAAFAAKASALGPSGGAEGAAFDTCAVTLAEGRPVTIAELRVRSGNFVDSIQVAYTNGLVSAIHGGAGGTLTTFALEPGETIVAVGGKYGRYVDSLFVKTSKGRVKQWGGWGGNASFSYKAPEGMWIGDFTGRAGQFVNAIGVCVIDPR